MKRVVVSFTFRDLKDNHLSNVLPSPLQKSFLSALTWKVPIQDSREQSYHIFYVYECLASIYEYAICVCLSLQWPEEGIISPGTRVTDGHHVNAGNQTQVICKSNKCS